MTSTPKKLNTAAMMIDILGLNERVEMQVAIALGASVQPLTNTTPNVKTVVIIKAGLDMSCCK